MEAKQPPEQTLFKSSHVQLCVHERIPSWVFDASLTPTLLRMDQKANIFWLQSASKVQVANPQLEKTDSDSRRHSLSEFFV